MNELGLKELSSQELVDIDGGGFIRDFALVSAYIAGDLIGSFMKGFDDGFHDGMQ
ncbi:hypothetical protein [Tenacibaculum sp. 190524A02b]